MIQVLQTTLTSDYLLPSWYQMTQLSLTDRQVLRVPRGHFV